MPRHDRFVSRNLPLSTSLPLSCNLPLALVLVLTALGAAAAGSAANGQVLAPNLIYTSIQPCRLFDTRVAGGALVANVNRQFNVVGVSAPGSLSSQGGNPAGCPIPGFVGAESPQVQAVVINLAVVTPSGTGVLQAWPSDQSKPNASVLNFTAAEVVLANGAVLPVRQDEQGGDITLVSNVGTHVLGDVAGYYSSGSPVQSPGSENLFLGFLSGNPGVATGIWNTVFGARSLNALTSGNFNTAVGAEAMSANTTGYSNVALGAGALPLNTTGTNNIAVGNGALTNLRTGTFNIVIGDDAGQDYSGAESSNILIGNPGQNGESNTIRIGIANGGQSSAYIAGIYGSTSSSGTEVFVNSSGQLGTTLSSLRFKEDVETMGDASDSLLRLRPVTFHYKAQFDDGSHLLQYGLIAEEVAKVYPDLVQYDADGRPLSVRYAMVNAMLLNEVQKQHLTITEQTAQLTEQQRQIAVQAAQIEQQRRQLTAQATQLDGLAKRLEQVESRHAPQ